jgi:hypothetical protein
VKLWEGWLGRRTAKGGSPRGGASHGGGSDSGGFMDDLRWMMTVVASRSGELVAPAARVPSGTWWLARQQVTSGAQ